MMNVRSFLRAAFFFLTIFFICSAEFSEVEAARKSAKHKKKAFRVSAQAAILLEGENLKRLYEKDFAKRVLPASTTKVLTAILALERLKLDQYVSVSQRAVNALPSKLGMAVGERFRVRDLLYAILLKSANDAAIVLAEAVSGSEEKFVYLMNQRAQKLGAKNTFFANSHGLPTKEKQYTTAYDMALIFRRALKEKFFDQVIEKRYVSIQSEAGRKISLKSHNSSLFKGWKKDVYGKTGYTNAAGACFVGQIMKGKKPLIVAVFNSNRRWDDVKYIIERYGGLDL